MTKDIKALCININSTIHDAIENLEVSQVGIVLVTEDSGKLVRTITDGDIRRAILEHIDFSESLDSLTPNEIYKTPITALEGTDQESLLKLLRDNTIRHLPIIDSIGRVTGLVTVDDFALQPTNTVEAVIMAGGSGTRLKPLTDDIPKPMLPLGDKPLMEIIIQQLKEANIQKVNVTLNHKPDKIIDYFGNGKTFGVDIEYITEDKPLGTAGSLKLMPEPSETILVINGDILTQVDFGAMVEFHKSHQSELTVAVQEHIFQIPYGVIECDGVKIDRLREKPELDFFINAGIYLMEPSVLKIIPSNQRFDMTDVIHRLIREQRPVVAFPVREYWKDIGQHSDYEQAQEQVKTWNHSK